MKFAHFADIHLGYEQYHQSWRSEDFSRVFREAVEKAVAEKVDFAIIAGDLFHRSIPKPKTIQEAMEILSIFKSNGIPVFAIEGNHDKTARDYSIYHLLESLGLLNLLGIRKEKVENEHMKSERINSVYLAKGIFEDVEIIGDTYRTPWQLPKVLPYLKAKSGESILVLHQAIKEIIDLGFQDSYELTLNDLPESSYYAMGHIHLSIQYEYNGRYIAYPGCPERYDAREASLTIEYTSANMLRKEGEKKGFFIVKDFKPRFIELNPRNLVSAKIRATNTEEAKTKLNEILDLLSSEDLLLAEIISDSGADIAYLNEMASKRTKFARISSKPSRDVSWRNAEVVEKSKFFDEFELELLEHLRDSSLDHKKLQLVVDLVEKHFGLEEKRGSEKEKEESESKAIEDSRLKIESSKPKLQLTQEKKEKKTLLDYL